MQRKIKERVPAQVVSAKRNALRSITQENSDENYEITGEQK